MALWLDGEVEGGASRRAAGHCGWHGGFIRRGQPHGGPVIEGTRDSLLLRLPIPRQLLGLGYLGRGHLLGNDIAVLDCIIAALAGG